MTDRKKRRQAKRNREQLERMLPPEEPVPERPRLLGLSRVPFKSALSATMAIEPRWRPLGLDGAANPPADPSEAAARFRSRAWMKGRIAVVASGPVDYWQRAVAELTGLVHVMVWCAPAEQLRRAGVSVADADTPVKDVAGFGALLEGRRPRRSSPPPPPPAALPSGPQVRGRPVRAVLYDADDRRIAHVTNGRPPTVVVDNGTRHGSAEFHLDRAGNVHRGVAGHKVAAKEDLYSTPREYVTNADGHQVARLNSKVGAVSDMDGRHLGRVEPDDDLQAAAALWAVLQSQGRL